MDAWKKLMYRLPVICKLLDFPKGPCHQFCVAFPSMPTTVQHVFFHRGSWTTIISIARALKLNWQMLFILKCLFLVVVVHWVLMNTQFRLIKISPYNAFCFAVLAPSNLRVNLLSLLLYYTFVGRLLSCFPVFSFQLFRQRSVGVERTLQTLTFRQRNTLINKCNVKAKHTITVCTHTAWRETHEKDLIKPPLFLSPITY